MDVASDDAIQFDICHTAFIEYGFEDFIKSVALYVGTGLLISTVTFIFKVRQDEL